MISNEAVEKEAEPLSGLVVDLHDVCLDIVCNLGANKLDERVHIGDPLFCRKLMALRWTLEIIVVCCFEHRLRQRCDVANKIIVVNMFTIFAPAQQPTIPKRRRLRLFISLEQQTSICNATMTKDDEALLLMALPKKKNCGDDNTTIAETNLRLSTCTDVGIRNSLHSTLKHE